ncbi:MAG: ATP-dependent 6-phosphofructokinase [Elusimicrobia bacterium RIFOXYD2_FULL_34_15]|nr:MAG: ATP-dependent 6-phosphofructokinase [Elusimicrobia bacterium RIFOXYD2_FULL_34_15]
MKKIAILTPGGDAPGMNACIRAVVRRSISSGMEVYGVMNGYQGLLDNNIFKMELRSVSGIINHGGTILKSSRCAEIKTDEGLSKAIATLKKYEIDYLVVIGGDGSIKAAEKISKFGISVIGIPASIDNDVYGTEETIGFDTAIDTAIEAVDKIRDTATSFDRVFIIEVMGREHGFLALEIGLASGAEFVFIPEFKFDLNKICEELKKDQQKKKTSVIMVFAEGCGDSRELAKKIFQCTGIDVKVSNLGYIQRGGNPSARSRNLASRFGSSAVDLILKDEKNKVVVLQECGIKAIPIEKVTSSEKNVSKDTLELIKKLAV